MPVTFGATQPLSGAGTWTYPDVGLVIGLKLDVTSPGPAPREWGTEIVRFRDLGVFAPITEAGKMLGRGIYNDTEVTYDVGKGPIGLAYDLASGVTINATEILSETPPSGGGGGGTVASVIWDQSTSFALPDSANTVLVPDVASLSTDPSLLDFGSGGTVTLKTRGVYLVTAQCWFDIALPGTEVTLRIVTDSTVDITASSDYVPSAPGYYVEATLVFHWDASTTVWIEGYQNSGSTQNVWPQYQVTLLTTY